MGSDAIELCGADIIPDNELVASRGLVGFVIWRDDAFSVNLRLEGMTVDDLASLASMADFVLAYMAR